MVQSLLVSSQTNEKPCTLPAALLSTSKPETGLSIYSCTFGNCGMIFHEKVEWMRHELKSHNARQYWICRWRSTGHMDGQLTTCYNISHDRTLHKLHMCQLHNISSEDLLEECPLEMLLIAVISLNSSAGIVPILSNVTRKGGRTRGTNASITWPST